MAQNPPDSLPPPGWYPQGAGQERWWNGASWSDAFRPTPSTQTGVAQTGVAQTGVVPYGQPLYGQPQYGQQPGYAPGYGQSYYAQPAGSSHVVRNVLLGVALVLVLLVGGCVAVIAVAANRVDRVVNDQTPGGRNVPLTITEGDAFSVEDLDYAAGWSIGADEFGSVTVTGLKVTNNGDTDTSDFVYVDLRSAGTRVARIDCYNDDGLIDPDESADLTCFSGDHQPTYDEITIREQ